VLHVTVLHTTVACQICSQSLDLGLPKSTSSCIFVFMYFSSFVRLYQQCQQQCLLPLCEISTCTIRVSYTLHHRRTVDNRCAPVQPAQRRYNRPRPTRTSCNRLNRLQPVPAPVASLHRLYRYRLQSHQSVVPVPVTGQSFSRSATDRLSGSATHYLWCTPLCHAPFADMLRSHNTSLGSCLTKLANVPCCTLRRRRRRCCRVWGTCSKARAATCWTPLGTLSSSQGTGERRVGLSRGALANHA
jgi:hypothetical protein